MKCTFTDCPNEATTIVYRYATDEERKQDTKVSERGATFPGMFEMEVCDAHLEQAMKEYPYRKSL